MTQRRRRRDTHPVILREIRQLAQQEDKPNALAIRETVMGDDALWRRLPADARNNKTKETMMPSLRTVQDIVREERPPDPGDQWRFGDAEPGEGRLVLESLGAVLKHSAGAKTYFTNVEADWIVRVRGASPSVSPFLAWRFARELLYRESKKLEITDLTAQLALWTDLTDEESVEAPREARALLARLWPDTPLLLPSIGGEQPAPSGSIGISNNERTEGGRR